MSDRFKNLADAFKRNYVRLPQDQAKGLAIMEEWGRMTARRVGAQAREREALEHSLAANIRRLELEWPARTPIVTGWKDGWREYRPSPVECAKARRVDLAEIRGLVATLRIIKRRLAELYFAPDDDQVDALTYAWRTLDKPRGERQEAKPFWFSYPPHAYPKPGDHPQCVLVEHTESFPLEGIKATTEAYLAERGKGWEVDVPPSEEEEEK